MFFKTLSNKKLYRSTQLCGFFPLKLLNSLGWFYSSPIMCCKQQLLSKAI